MFLRDVACPAPKCMSCTIFRGSIRKATAADPVGPGSAPVCISDRGPVILRPYLKMQPGKLIKVASLVLHVPHEVTAHIPSRGL